MCRVRASAFLACATCLTISCSANPRSLDEGKVLVWSRDTARQGPTQRDSIRPQFEPSYVVFSVLGRYAPKPGPGPHHILLEANVAPPFYIVSWGHNAIVLTPKIILRQFAGQSWPVRPPSFMPRATYYHWWPDRRAGVNYFSFMVSHDSNGQEGSPRNADSTLNHVNGNFSL